MNLMKYFNFNFFKENIKKSKGILLFSILIIPVIYLIMFFGVINDGTNILAFGEISIITYIASIILPAVISYVLNGFLFKQKSVDFYMSKPLSRKTMFTTNLIGGFILLLSSLLLNIIIFAIFSMFMVIPFWLIVDYFIYFAVSYLLMYTVYTLAIYLSGNFITSVVVIMLLIFMVPFLKVVTYYVADNNSNYYIECTSDECKPKLYSCYSDSCESHLENNEYLFSGNSVNNIKLSMPFAFTLNPNFSWGELIKSTGLSIIYIFLAYIVFIKRKMEDNNCSFKNEKVHYFVKSLTFLPIVFFSYYTISHETSLFVILFTLLGTFAYYIIYDLVTRKSIYKFRKSIIVYSISFLAFLSIFFLLDLLVVKDDVVLNKIDKITISNYTTNDYRSYKEIVIDDELTINRLLAKTLDKSNANSYEILYALFDTNKGNINMSLPLEQNDSIINDYIRKFNVKSDLDNFDIDSVDYIELDNKKIKITKELKDILKNCIDYKYNEVTSITMRLYNYTNHNFEEVILPINASKELENYAISLLNQMYIDTLNNNSNISVRSNKFGYAFEYVIRKNKYEFMKYLEMHKNDEVQDNYYIISSYDMVQSYSYFVNDTKSFDEIYQKWYDSCKDDEQFKQILKSLEDTDRNTIQDEDYEY